MPITDTGFEARTEYDIIMDARAALEKIQDPVSGEFLKPSFNPDDPAMQLVLVPLSAIARIEDALKLVSDQFDPDQTTGASLSGGVMMNGLRRRDATRTRIVVTCSGTAGTIIPTGAKFSDQLDSSVFFIESDVTIAPSGTVDAVGLAQDYGIIDPPLNSLTKIITPISGWDNISNTLTLTLGQNEESDSDLRARRDASTSAPSVSLIDGLRANLLDIDGVTFARCYQNINPNITDSRGITPSTLACVVEGGDVEAVARAIFTRFSMSKTQGNTAHTFADKLGNLYDIYFYRPIRLDIAVEVRIQVYNQPLFGADGVERIKQAIIDYSLYGSKGLGIDDGFDEGFNVGVAVESTRLYTAVNSVNGHRILGLFVGIAGGAINQTTIPVDFNQVASFSLDNISVVLA